MLSFFQFSKVTSGASGNDDSALDLSGRFMDAAVFQKPLVTSKCDATTQTQSSGISVISKPPTDRSTSTDSKFQ